MLILILSKQGTVIPVGITVVFSKPMDILLYLVNPWIPVRVRCSQVWVQVQENIPAGYPCHTLYL